MLWNVRNDFLWCIRADGCRGVTACAEFLRHGAYRLDEDAQLPEKHDTVISPTSIYSARRLSKQKERVDESGRRSNLYI